MLSIIEANKRSIQKRYWINNQISAETLRVIDDQGENLGVLSTKEALEQAYSKDLDLVLISPEADPPVARIVKFDKFRYQQEKEEKKQKSKVQELKRIRFSARSADHDLQTQVRKVEKFLGRGDRVEIILRLRGRERGNRDWARSRHDKFLGMIEYEYRVTTQPKFGGMGMNMQIAPK